MQTAFTHKLSVFHAVGDCDFLDAVAVCVQAEEGSLLVQANFKPWPWVDPKFSPWKIAIGILGLKGVPIV